MKEYESLKRIGTQPHRSYYIPFDESDTVKSVYGIVDRRSSSRFLSLDGIWYIKQHSSIESVELNEDLTQTIPVPSCVQMHGFDNLQYINVQYPIPITYPHIVNKNPCWHYRREFLVDKKQNERYYINFEGVDSAFYLYINGEYKGYSQISHSTSEFDITDLVINGTNIIDVVVLKWCVSTFLEDQDKFRFSGIFRSVYILKRPQNHITDYRFIATLEGNDGVFTFFNESQVGILLKFIGKSIFVPSKKQAQIYVKNVRKWTADSPNLYTLEIGALGEKIIEKVGFRKVSIEGKVFKINDKHIKLKGVNRHDFNTKTGATVTLKNLVEDLRLMKWLNVNAIRTSHYPNMPEFYHLCDKFGMYVMDEADLEMHGVVTSLGGWDWKISDKLCEDAFFEEGITDRHMALVERDKNRACVIIWSLGNESGFGKAFFKGAKYIRKRDSRPIHYESLQEADKKFYYTKLVDMVSMMYPSLDRIKERVLNNPKETRPFVLCEYTHAMGNSCGDIAAYWDLINQNDQCMGGFVWEWADHGIKTKKGFLYGGDFGETEHDGNFCCDGLVTPDRKLKSAALTMKAVYGGKTKSQVTEVEIPQDKPSGKKLEIKVDKYTGCISSIMLGGQEIMKKPMAWNFIRYIDNDMRLVPKWQNVYRLTHARPEVLSIEKKGDNYHVKGLIVANCVMPLIEFEVKYIVSGSELSIDLSYKIGDHVEFLPRFGFELCLDKKYQNFAYVGFGECESYVDKNVASEYGYYESNAKDNYDNNYIRPQESGSHYYSKYLKVNNLFSMTADKPFSFSINPYTTSQLFNTKHNFELKENDFVCACIDIAMRGVGSYSCGPFLDKEHEIPKEANNLFKLKF